MRENPSKTTSMETLSLNGFQPPYNGLNNEQKQMLFTVSSNVYYGYQPLTNVQTSSEPMHTEDLNKSCDKMDIGRLETPFINRKRARSHADIAWGSCKKRRQNDDQKPSHLPLHCSPSKMVSDEDLLRETHGCSYYHWVANNI